MAELQPSKLVMRVRFPSPAPVHLQFFDFKFMHVPLSAIYRSIRLPIPGFIRGKGQDSKQGPAGAA
jgi:hypothetical protein